LHRRKKISGVLGKATQRRRTDDDSATEVPMSIRQSFPGSESSVLLRICEFRVLPFTDADGIETRRSATFDCVVAFETIHVLAGIERNTFDFANASASSIPCRIRQLEQHTDRTIGEHPRIHKVRGRIQMATAPNAIATATARASSGVKIPALTVIAMIIVNHVPVVDNQAMDSLDPHIHGTAGQWLLRPGFESLAVHAMRDVVVLPREVIFALAYKAAIGLEFLRCWNSPLANG